ncbi:MAG: peptidylprolyl isomerase [Candidatus Zixiibacteriota bacterium]
MFQFLRRMIFPIIIIALVGFLATIVFQWGMDISSRSEYLSANTAARINGEDISWQDFNVIYDRLYQNELGNEDLDLSEYQKKELRTAAWQQLLHDKLVMQEVAKHELTVSDEELYAYLRFSPPADLQRMEPFQTNGQFDYQKYMSAMADPNAASFWSSIEPFVRQEIQKQKLQAMVIQTAQVTDDELKRTYISDNEKVKLGVVNVPFGRFSGTVQPAEEELLAYYNQHATDYTVDERVVLNMVMIPKQPTAYDWEVDSTRAAWLYDSLQTGANFAELAQYYSEDVTAQSGGDLGWFRQGQMVGPFDSTVFSMKRGEISKPVKTEFGWHIIKLLETRDTGTGKDKVKEAHAAHILVKVTPSAETLDAIHKRLSDFRTAAVERGFEQAASDFNLEIIKTKPFAKGQAIDNLGADRVANDFAFAAELNDMSLVQENRDEAYILQLAEKLPAGQASFDEVRDQVRIAYEDQVLRTMCRDTASAIYAETQQGTDLNKAAEKHGAEYKISDNITRNSYISGLGVGNEAVGVAFAMTEKGQISEPVDYSRGSAVLQLLERTYADMTQFEAKRDSLYQVVLQNKQRELYSRWFDHLVETSDIVNNIEEAFEQQTES